MECTTNVVQLTIRRIYNYYIKDFTLMKQLTTLPENYNVMLIKFDIMFYSN